MAEPTKRRYVALLRAISNLGMERFRKALEDLRFTDVESYGMSGNLMFNAPRSDKTSLERRITAKLEATAIVRTRGELAKIVAANPFAGRAGASVLFLARPPAAARRRAFREMDFAQPFPVLRGSVLFHVWPTTLRGKKTPVALERVLGVRGTARSARVVSAILKRMSESPKR